MASKRYSVEQIVAKLREAEKLQAQLRPSSGGASSTARSRTRRGDPFLVRIEMKS